MLVRQSPLCEGCSNFNHEERSGFWPLEGNTCVKTHVDFPKPFRVTGSHEAYGNSGGGVTVDMRDTGHSLRCLLVACCMPDAMAEPEVLRNGWWH